jgi:3-hydroxybutyryl-CoA dehydrogenase
MSALPARAAVAGGGAMGAGITTALAIAKVPTTVVVRRPEAVEEARARVTARLEAHLELGLIDRQTASAAEEVIEVRGAGDGGPYDLVVECVSEDVATKRALLERIEPALAVDGVLTTTTSSLRVDDLASALVDSTRFLAWHWFHPADLVPLVEIVPGARTRPDVAQQVREWSLTLGKAPLGLRHDVPGFVANRLQYALLREAYALVVAGVCTPKDVDLAVTAALGLRWSAIGPFSLMDLAGLDVHAAAAETLFPELDQSTRLPELLVELRRNGALGVKNGRGLLGRYSQAAIQSVVNRRDRVLADADRAYSKVDDSNANETD